MAIQPFAKAVTPQTSAHQLYRAIYVGGRWAPHNAIKAIRISASCIVLSTIVIQLQS
ncbi:MAG: hypothetical protein QGI86_00770 [Candidatus Poribacteria bacterium]|nr:hypothetical protein [Candidatus Poribacteria bacterium]MDP6747415.1 hypothetical protein [Candidatus Poribacteria bacterium]MDP6998635.1 hypothetical protein [Candidatus Poribacteria bacterium]